MSVQQCSNLYNLSTTSKILVQVCKVWHEKKNKFALIFQSFELEKFGTRTKLDLALIFPIEVEVDCTNAKKLMAMQNKSAKRKVIAQQKKSWQSVPPAVHVLQIHSDHRLVLSKIN